MTSLPDSPPTWKRPPVLEVIVGNLIPAAGLIWLDWSGWTVLLVYWLEAAIVGVVNVFRMALARPVYASLAEHIACHPWFLRNHPISEEEWRLARETPMPIQAAHKELMIPLFVGHYSLFLAVHAVLLLTVVAGAAPSQWWTVIRAEFSLAFAAAVLVLLAEHVWSFWKEELQGRGYTQVAPMFAMVLPYRQLLAMHVALFLGGMVISSFSLPATLALLLIAAKAGFDLKLVKTRLQRRLDWKEAAGRMSREAAEQSGSNQAAQVDEKPAWSRASLRETGDGLRFELPPRGIREVSSKLGTFGCLTVGILFSSVPTVMLFVVPQFIWHDLHSASTTDYWGVLLPLTMMLGVGTFWLLIVSMMVSMAWNSVAMGRSRAVVELDEQSLRIRERTIFRWREASWPRAQVADVAAANSGPFKQFELVIRTRHEDPGRRLTGRELQELRWIAWTLREKLGLNAST